MKTSALLVLSLAASALMTCAQEPKVTSPQFHSGPVTPGLSATVDRFRQSNRPLWLGYAVPALPPAHLSSCSPGQPASSLESGCCHEVRLEDTQHDLTVVDHKETSASVTYVLLRVDHGELVHVRTASPDCALNAGAVPFEWITGVSPEESVRFLEKLAETPVMDEALASLSLHATPNATDALATLAASGKNNRLHERAAFWLGAQRGHYGLLALRKLVRDEQDSKLREKLAFDLSLSSDPAAIDDLIHMASADSDDNVRGQALFWLAQKAGRKAIGTLSASLENDPSFEVRKKAVFAISQLSKEESVPQLVRIADTNANFAIRKQAIFWLGQSRDPRALAYIEELLKR
jgi:hypothetical protein